MHACMVANVFSIGTDATNSVTVNEALACEYAVLLVNTAYVQLIH